MAEEATITTTTGEEPGAAPEKTFTQAEVDNIVSRRIARATKGMPSEDELSAFRAWQENQQTEADKIEKLTGERDTANTALAAANAELEQYRRERYLIGHGVAADDVDYYAYKIGKLVTDDKDFETAAGEYLAAHQKPKEEAPPPAATGPTVTVSTGAPIGGGNLAPRTLNETINSMLRGGK